jgi:Uncharacterised nucleotidyltransferase
MIETPTTQQENVELLLDLLRNRFESENLPWVRTPGWDWSGFADLCERHGVASLIFARLRNAPELPIPQGLFEHLQSRFFEIAARNYFLAQRIVELADAFERDGIPVLAIKGPTTAMIAYGELALRQYDDLDLIVPEESLIAAVESMRRRGFEDVSQGGRPYLVPEFCRPENAKDVAAAEEIPFRSPDRNYFVDLHWKLGHDYWRDFCPDVRMIWQRTAKMNLLLGSVSTLCREDLLLALCSHGTKHRWLCLKWLIDIAELISKPDALDWSRVEEMIRVRPGAGVAARVGLRLVETILEVPMPPDALRIMPPLARCDAVAAAIREEILQAGQSTGSYYQTLIALEEGAFARMRIRADITRRFPAGLFREVVLRVTSKDRAVVNLPENFGFLYHLVRPVRLIAKHTMRLIRGSA